MTKIQELTQICESFSQLHNYKNLTRDILVNKFGFDPKRLSDKGLYNLFYVYPEGTLTEEVATKLVKTLQDNADEFIINDNPTSNVVTIVLQDGKQGPQKYKIIFDVVKSLFTLSVFK